MKEKRNGKTRFQRHCREKSIKLRGFEFLKFSQKRVLLYFRNHRVLLTPNQASFCSLLSHSLCWTLKESQNYKKRERGKNKTK